MKNQATKKATALVAFLILIGSEYQFTTKALVIVPWSFVALRK